MTSTVHEFGSSHRWEQEQASFLASLWSSWWPGVVRVPATDRSTQLRGIDAFLAEGARDPRAREVRRRESMVAVEEKVRRRDYGDVLLELEADSVRKVPGWAVKGSDARLLLYAFADSRRAWVFPMPAVQKVAIERGPVWLDRFGRKIATNRSSRGGTYDSTNVAVPVGLFVLAINDAHPLFVCPTCRMISRWSDLRGPTHCRECSPDLSFQVLL